MKRKRFLAVIMAMVMTLAMSMTSFAASWQQNATGWWWQNDDGSWPANCWQWLDGNRDGVAECYYFNGDGYMLANTTTPDGYTVNADGAWTVNGVVQTKSVAVNNTNTTTNSGNHNAGYDPAHPLAGKIDEWNLRLRETNFATGELGTVNTIGSWNVQAMLTGQMDQYTGFKGNEQAIYEWFCNWLNSFDFENMSEMERATKINDYFKTCTYDSSYADNSTEPLYAVLIEKKGVCREFTMTTVALAKSMGLKFAVTQFGNHSWTYVQVDGKTYISSNGYLDLERPSSDFVVWMSD